MTLGERLAELKDEKAIVAIVYGNLRILDFKEQVDKDLDTRYKDYGLKDLEVEFAHAGSAYAQEPETLVVRLLEPKKEESEQPEEAK